MRHCLITLAAAALAVAAPSALDNRQVGAVDVAGTTDAVTSEVADVTGAADDALPANLGLGPLIDQLIAAGGGAGNRQDMTQEELDAMREVETIIADIRQQLEKIEAKQPKNLSRRQLEILGGLPLVGGILSSLGLGGGGGGGLEIGGLTAGLLGKVDVESLTAEEMDMAKEAETILEEFLRQLAAENEGNEAQVQNRLKRRQLDILFSLPIVGPLLRALLGGGGLGGITGTLGGVTGTVGGLTGGAGGPLGAVTGALGGVTGGLGGLTGGLGGVTGGLGGLTGGLPLGAITGLLGKIDINNLRVTQEQTAMARKADDILGELVEKIQQRAE